MASSESWEKIFKDHKILSHDFRAGYFHLSNQMIKDSCQNFKKTTQKEVRILCKQDCREVVPDIMREHGLFLLPIKNGSYAILQGEGYMDIPEIDEATENYQSKLGFTPKSSAVGNSEMQHVDFAFATSLIRTFMDDNSLVLTIRGRKYTPEFSFRVGQQAITAKSVQTEVDAGFEGKDKIVLLEAKNSKTTNVIIRQLYYPFRQWRIETGKKIHSLFFEKRDKAYFIWEYDFKDEDDYNSIELIRSAKFEIKN